MTTLPEILNYISQTSQSIVKFLFASKWSIPIIILLVILFIFWKGLGGEKKPVEDGDKS